MSTRTFFTFVATGASLALTGVVTINSAVALDSFDTDIGTPSLTEIESLSETASLTTSGASSSDGYGPSTQAASGLVANNPNGCEGCTSNSYCVMGCSGCWVTRSTPVLAPAW